MAEQRASAAGAVTLRPAAPEDRELLFGVYASTREEELAPVPWPPEAKDAFLRQQRAIIGRPDSRPDLATIRCPTVVIAGGDDALMAPEIHEEMAARVPGAQRVRIDGCGHLASIERPGEVTTALRGLLRRAAPVRN